MNIKILLQAVSIISVSAWIVGCASTGMTQSDRTDAYNTFITTEKLEPLKHITAFRFDSWSTLGQNHLIIRTSFNKPYLITLKNRCYDLRMAQVIGIDNTGSTLQAGFDSIVVDRNHPQKCYIDSIYKITKEQKQALLKVGDDDGVEKKPETPKPETK
ncbi:MAG: hypothetical protein GY781_03925 [Gammaproteobacteria bacterium]|nr:hypothetical protein [Gammaproteobacteria bacterium]